MKGVTFELERGTSDREISQDHSSYLSINKKVVRSTQLANMNNKKATISESCLEAEEMK